MGGICFFNTAQAWGGGEKWHFEISKHLHQKGYNVFVFAHAKSVLLQKLIEVQIPSAGVSISNLSFLNPFQYLKLVRLLKTHQFDTIVMNLSRDVKVAGPSAKKAGIKRIIYRRGSAIPIKNSFLNRYYFKNVLTEVLANSMATQKTVLENNASLIAEEKITVIYNGIKIEAEAEERPPNEIFTLINLGRLEYQKNQRFLIKLAAELKKRQLPFKMLIGGEGSLKKELEDSIKQFNVENEVELVGFIEKPLRFIAQADVFLLSSFWEGFGYVLAEAALCKKPIIAFDTSSNPELVIDGKNGYLVPENNMIVFADKIEELFKDPKLGKRLGETGSQLVLKNFDKDKQLRKIEEYLVHA
ncbi:glycosyltransferase [uncultured Croceitalea sp.]|uniref:glycosyltransferase n=1 Tax=uncultured Croceitalea sp. TaxID=1798908 RepID=UPI003305AAEB